MTKTRDDATPVVAGAGVNEPSDLHPNRTSIPGGTDTFVLVLRAENRPGRGNEPAQRLRKGLKSWLRTFGFRCESVAPAPTKKMRGGA